MEPTAQKPQDFVDTTDSLEAVGSCRSMKNFLFFIILIGLLLPQSVFWLNRLGLIQPACGACAGTTCPSRQAETQTTQPPSANADGISLLPLSAAVNVAEEVEKVTEQDAPVQTAAPAQPAGDDTIVLDAQAEQAEAPADEPETQPQADIEPLRISRKYVKPAIVISNFLVIAGTILYCLTLLICLKISLAGRLGGMHHITKAFFISLFLVVIVFPWQQLLPRVLIGAVWMPRELFCGGWAKTQESVVCQILFYLRFCGLWFLAVWFLFWAQFRTGKWARATLRRLGVVR